MDIWICVCRSIYIRRLCRIARIIRPDKLKWCESEWLLYEWYERQLYTSERRHCERESKDIDVGWLTVSSSRTWWSHTCTIDIVHGIV